MKRGGDVDRQSFVPGLRIESLHRRRVADDGVVDEDVDGGESPEGGGHHLLDFPRPPQVGARIHRPHAMIPFDAAPQIVDVRSRIETVHHQVTAGCGKSPRRRQPESPHRSGDQRASAVQRPGRRLVSIRTRRAR
jgi:hypothetical protein